MKKKIMIILVGVSILFLLMGLFLQTSNSKEKQKKIKITIQDGETKWMGNYEIHKLLNAGSVRVSRTGEFYGIEGVILNQSDIDYVDTFFQVTFILTNKKEIHQKFYIDTLKKGELQRFMIESEDQNLKYVKDYKIKILSDKENGN